MIRDILQKQYDFELEQRNSIGSATNVPIVALTILGGALSSMLIGFHYSNDITTYCFVVSLLLSVISMFFSLYCVVRTFLGYLWQKIPPAKSLRIHLEELEDWHRNNGENREESNKRAKKDFDIYFDERLSEAADRNSVNNITRGNYLHNATAAVTIAFVFLVISTPFYIYQKVVKVDDVYKVKIVNELTLFNEEKSMGDNKDSGNKSKTKQATPVVTPKTTTAKKPTGPPNIEFRSYKTTTSVKTAVSPVAKNTKTDTSKK